MIRVVLVTLAVLFVGKQNVDSWEQGGKRKEGKSILWAGDSSFGTPSPGSVPLFLLHLLKKKLKYQIIQRVTTSVSPVPSCICVPYYICDSNNVIITDGIGLIDIRSRRCTGDLEVCCRLPNATTPTLQPIPTGIPTGVPTMRPTMLPTMPPIMPPIVRPTMPPTMPPPMPPTMPSPMPPTMPPTMVPIMPPTMPPTMPPIVRPTMPPTMPPPMPPTMPSPMPPTMPPTMVPIMPPTMPPTMPPIVRPTMPPTMPSPMPPTMPPTMVPIMPPTIVPIMPPTMPPTMPPIVRPTMPPTMPSPMPPTMPPTMRPTMVPTMPPTMPPTMRPTMIPTMPPTMIPTMPTMRPTTFPTVSPNTNCVCVPASLCDANGIVIVSGEGLINPRQQIVNICPAVGQVCCALPMTMIQFPATPPVTIPPLPTSSPLPMITTIPSQSACYCVKTWQCDANGFIIVSGAGSIDPRFPTGRQGQNSQVCFSADEICCRFPPTGQDSGLGFPTGFPPATGNTLGPIRNPGTPQECICVKTWQCSDGNAVSVDGSGIVDPRFGICSVADEICCRSQGISTMSSPLLINSREVLIVSQNGNVEQATCGIRGTTYTSGQSRPSNSGETYFAEFPWMAALLVRQTSGSLLFQCGASLLNSKTVLTAAHCVINRDPSTLVVRVGEWDTQNNNEPLPFQEANVSMLVAHPQFYSGGLYHDVAIVILKTPVYYAANVMPICLPQQGMTVAAGTRCFATGWGSNAFGAQGNYQVILRQVDLPIVERSECQARLRTTRLGQYFQLHGSFLCAGGEPSKDTCQGDGGGPLVCPDANGQYIQAGIVSWGIGCGASSTPAVYASVSQHRQWIDQQLANYGVY